MSDTTIAGRIRKALKGISDSYDDTLEPARRLVESHAVGNLTDPPLPVPACVLDARRGACDILDRWYMHIRNARRLKVGIERWDVARLTGFLTVHADWLGESTSGPRAAGELEKSSTLLEGIAADNAPRRFDVGKCPGTTNNAPCPGMVRATVRSDDDLLPSELACDATPRHAWPAGEWRMLERRLHMNEAAARRLAVVITSR